MKLVTTYVRLPSLYFFTVLAIGLGILPESHAGLTIQIDLIRFNGGQYYTCSPNLSTNGNGADATPLTYHQIYSPGSNFSAGLGSGAVFMRNNYTDFNSFIHAVTNGPWQLVMNAGSPSQHIYSFNVTNLNLTSNDLAAATVDYPTNGATGVSSLPLFAWRGPANYTSLFVEVFDNNFTIFQYDFPSLTATNDYLPPALAPGQYYFNLDYWRDASASVVASTPTDVSNNTVSGWISTAQLDAADQPLFTVVNSSTPPETGHTLVAHFPFDNSGNLGLDTSGNNYSMNVGGTFGGSRGYNTDAIAGGGAVRFTTDGFGNGAYMGWSPTPPALLSALSGSFSVSLWVKTTNSFGSQGDLAFNGAGIVTADVEGLADDVVPVALTGGQVAFNVGGPADDTLHSSALVNNGGYHHIVVTREQTSGQRKIYIDGLLNISQYAATNALSDPQIITIGSVSTAEYADPFDAGYYHSYDGLLDDVQFYSGVLSSNEIAQMYSTPGATVPNIIGGSLSVALDNTNLTWTTGGDAVWTYQTNESYDGIDAAVSGAIGDDQTSYLQTTIPTSGTIFFYWKVSSEDGADFLNFNVNDTNVDSITGEVDWEQYSYSVSAGDVLTWEYAKDGSETNGTDQAWLDHVVYIPDVNQPNNISARLHLEIHREQNPDFGDVYVLFPSFDFITPAPVTFHSVESPHGFFIGGGNSTSSYILSSLSSLINECTDTNLWKLYINKGDLSQQVFSFSVSFTSLDTNILKPVALSAPTNGLVTTSTNIVFRWTGPTNYSSLALNLGQPSSGGLGSTNLPVTATNWPSPPSALVGTNRFDVDYSLSNAPQVLISVPVNAFSVPVSNWTAHATLHTTAASLFIVQPGITIVDATKNGTNFNLSFVSLLGKSHTVEARTNAASGVWTPLTNFTGDGTLKQFSFPATNPPIRFFRISTQ